VTRSTYYVDESGFTGEDLLAPDQPLFAQATNNFTSDEAKAIIGSAFSGVDAKELKHSRLCRNPRHRDRIIELVRIVARDPTRAGTWIAHKEFALVTFIVDWWMEPLAHRGGLNLYNDGANFGMANMLFICLQGYWSEAFRRNLLLHFQRMFRSRTPERFAECEAIVRKEMSKVDGDRAEILRYFWPFIPAVGSSTYHWFLALAWHRDRDWRRVGRHHRSGFHFRRALKSCAAPLSPWHLFSSRSRRRPVAVAIIITAGIIPIPAIKFIEATSTAMDRQKMAATAADIITADITTTPHMTKRGGLENGIHHRFNYLQFFTYASRGSNQRT
jgi:hypothetical protein